jgi:hypothetical protein
MTKASQAPSEPSPPGLLQPRPPRQLSMAFEPTVTLDLTGSDLTNAITQLATLLLQAAGLAAGDDDGQR